MNKNASRLRRFSLPFLFAAIVFVTLILTLLIIGGGTLLLFRLGVLEGMPYERVPLLLLALASLLIGTVLAAIISRRPLAPLREIMDATDKIAAGDYSVRVRPKGFEEFKDLGQKFNHMAEELNSVELLRTDFVNNFSHEFKTPIVSIRGFAKMLKMEDLTDEERDEYLDIIIEESERLSELSANVLYLSKLEQQTILTNKHLFNVSEQIRLVIAMMDSKWLDKHMEFVFDSPEIELYGNEELLKQVWINLLDNAIKFSPKGEVVRIAAASTGEVVEVSFTNQGKPMSEDTLAHIFDKFYQGDTSHAEKGNGLGLTIAQKIVELHGGGIIATSSEKDGSCFIVKLPVEHRL